MVWIGDAGVGKSRLLQECRTIKSAASVFHLQCGSALAFGPCAPSQLGAALGLAPEGGATRIRTAALSVLADRVRRRPAAILIDDLQRADPEELAFVDALFAMAMHHRIVAIGFARVRGATEEDRWQRCAAEVKRLQPLDGAAIEMLIRGLPRARRLHNDDVREILKAAQGNPRLAIELVDCALRANGRVPTARSVRAAVAEIREALSRSDFEILLACSVFGEEFFGEWIAEVARRSKSQAADALQRAYDLGALVEVAGSPGWLRFAHPTIRNALYGSTVAPKRRILHERIVALLRADGAASGSRNDALLARHADVLESHELAAESFARAGDRLREDAEFGNAAEMYVRAARHANAGSTAWLDLKKRAIACYLNLGDWKGIEVQAQSVLQTIDREREAAAVEHALKHLFFAQLNDSDHDAAERTARELATLGLPTSENRGRSARLILAYGLCYRGDLAEARRLLATVSPANLTDNEVRLRYLVAKAEIGALVTPLERTIRLVDEAVALSQQMTVRGTVICCGVGAEVACRYGDLARAREYVARAESFAAKGAGQINDLRRNTLKQRTRIAWLEGDLLSVAEIVRSNIGWRESGRHNEAFDAGVAVSTGMHIGDLALIDAFFDASLLFDSAAARDAESCGWLLPGFAHVMQVRGMAKGLREILQRCIAKRMIDPYVAIQLTAIRFASTECAERAGEQVEAYFSHAVAPAAKALVPFCSAALLRRRGRHIAASEQASEAAGRFREIGWSMYEAMALELAGNAPAASRLYRQCGANSDVARLAAGETRKRRYAPFGARLSPREREIAQLVGSGRTNRDIARALDISARTVDHHVEAVYSKLGIRARWQLTREVLSGAPPNWRVQKGGADV